MAGERVPVQLPAQLTAVEIDRLFPKQWVLVDRPKSDRNGEVRSGKLVFHTDRRDDIYIEATRLGLKDVAIWYTGPADPALRFLL